MSSIPAPVDSTSDVPPQIPATDNPTEAFPASKPPPSAHLDNGPKAQETPERISNIPTTNDHAPAIAKSHPSTADNPVDHEIQDLGWSEDPRIPVPLIHGLFNEELWVLVRRFNKQISHVRVTDEIYGGLDLNTSDEEEFSPDKLRATLERLYISVIVPIAAFLKHISRIRSWREPRRTAYFCITYYAAWALDLLMPVFFATLIVLILSPRARVALFPPVPVSAVSASSGELKTPPAAHQKNAGAIGSASHPKDSSSEETSSSFKGHPRSKDSLTGAAESYKGQAVELEASNFVAGLSSIAVSSATGQGAPSAVSTDEEKKEEEMNASGKSWISKTAAKVKSPTEVVMKATEAQSKASGDPQASTAHDKTKVPVTDAVWNKARPVMHALGEVSDTWERFGNALSPVPPFSQHTARLRLAGVIGPILLLSLFIQDRWVYKGIMFGLGAGMFGQPVFDHVHVQRLIDYLNTHYPGWQKQLQLRNSLLYGVPTNAELTLTMLRIGEANKSPLPPPPPPSHAPIPPTATPSPYNAPTNADGEDDYTYGHEDDGLEGDYTDSETLADPDEQHTHTSDADAPPKKKKNKGSRVLSAIKSTTKAGVSSVLHLDHARAKVVGSETSKARVGVVKPPDPATLSAEEVNETSKKDREKIIEEDKKKRARDGPAAFEARYEGTIGRLVISTSATTPCVAFEVVKTPSAILHPSLLGVGKSTEEKEERKKESEETEPVWSVAIEDIQELKRVGGLGWGGKMLVGWSMGREVKDALEIIEREGAVGGSGEGGTSGGRKIKVTAIPRRDEVFNRLIAIGQQKWESL